MNLEVKENKSLLWLNRNKINKYDELPKTNARLEALKEKAFTGGAEKISVDSSITAIL